MKGAGIMGSANFKQYDSRWGRNAYAGHNMIASGCGPTAIADLVYSINQGVTPWTVAQWLATHGYASNGDGTYWSGIKAALEAYGFSVNWHNSMTQLFTDLANGQYGILLFKRGTVGGVTWTLGGHFVAVRDYKVVNGEHWLYIGDPGQRNHDGWYCYERHMRGLILQCWSCVASGSAPSVVPSAQVQSTGGATYSVNSSIGLNIRAGAGTNYARVGGVANGTSVTITERSGNWGFSPSLGGWLCMDYLRSSAVAAPARTAARYQVGRNYTVVANGGLRVRTGAGTNYPVKLVSQLTPSGRAHAVRGSRYALLMRGTVVTCMEVSGNWIRIPSGWICTGDGKGTYVV